MFILASTPMKTHLPGYLKESERTATEEQHLRLDSLVKVYEVNEAYITGILDALNPSEETGIKENLQKDPNPLIVDSLMPASDEERLFMENIRERDRYNISPASPAAAQTMLFQPLNKGAVISEESKNSFQAEIILPKGGSVSSIADGKVISIANSPRTSGGYEIIIQHPKGFLSKSSRLSNIMVNPGQEVSGGQIIASGSVSGGMKSNRVIFELWHDGEQLVPATYINGSLPN